MQTALLKFKASLVYMGRPCLKERPSLTSNDISLCSISKAKWQVWNGTLPNSGLGSFELDFGLSSMTVVNTVS